MQWHLCRRLSRLPYRRRWTPVTATAVVLYRRVVVFCVVRLIMSRPSKAVRVGQHHHRCCHRCVIVLPHYHPHCYRPHHPYRPQPPMMSYTVCHRFHRRARCTTLLAAITVPVAARATRTAVVTQCYAHTTVPPTSSLQLFASFETAPSCSSYPSSPSSRLLTCRACMPPEVQVLPCI